MDDINTPEALLSTLPHAILFECIAGSRAYGTATADSDEDTRGIFAVPAGAYLNLERPPDQVSDERSNVVYYSLRRVIELLMQANPNILELLFMPDDCVRKTSPEMQLLIAERDIFISKHCADTHVGYAMSQIKKAKGRNETRRQQQEHGEIDFDAKNMMHTVRLLMSGRSIVATGKPMIRFTGAEFELLMMIRAGKRSFEEIVAIAEAIMEDCERLKQVADLPTRSDPAKATHLLRSLTLHWEQRC
jgi:predicted nucleotidyltransferase